MSEQPAAPGRGSVEEIFHAARTLEGAQRKAFLDGACGDNAPLRRRVEALLSASETGGGFLPEQPRDDAVGKPLNPAKAVTTERAGDRIGNYELLEQIGAGGFGIVFKARQVAPVQRIVAVKILKLGMDTLEVMARFEAERQTLAAMDHPNIAKVFDAGATETGRPFFVMEFVDGISITAYADRHRLTTESRLELFTRVCRAVQHAHTKGIIHRDIKPSNVLVLVQDGEAVPKLIDFGIAKATERSVGFQTVATALGVLGTPAYMSPEQADMRRPDIDTRSDVYSLGVLLYELLTGHPPFEPGEMLRLALDEALKTIREREPPRPSVRLEKLAQEKQTETAQRRQTGPARLRHLLRGDLDCIVMKCLEKDRGRRYESANDLALDVRRYLGNEPIAASPPDIIHRLGKFARRHRSALAAGAAVFLALLGGWLYWWFLPGTLLLEVIPPDAQLEIDGRAQAAGKIPRQLKLPAGIHQLRFHKPEFEDELRTFVAPHGGFASLPFLELKHYQGKLDVDSTMPGTAIESGSVDYFGGIANQPADTGEYDLLAFGDECFDAHHHLAIRRDQTTADRFSLEKGVTWELRSTAVQGDCLLITNCPAGQPPVLVENMLDEMRFLSAADGSVLGSYPTPYAQNRGALTRINLGGKDGGLILTGAEDPENGPVLSAYADAWPTKLLWEWHGPKETYTQACGLAITAVANPGGVDRLAVAGRDGRVFLLDENGHPAGRDIIISKTPLPTPPELLTAWSQSGQTRLLAVFRVEGTLSGPSADTPFQGALAEAATGKMLWEKTLGRGLEAWLADIEHSNAPSILLFSENECQVFGAEGGERRSRFSLPGRAESTWLVNMGGPGLGMVFKFSDPDLPLLAVRPSDGRILWQGPTNLCQGQHCPSTNRFLQAFSSPLVVVDANSTVSILEPSTGKITWQAQAPVEDFLRDDATGNIYLTTKDRRLFCLDSAGGTNWILRLHDMSRPLAIIPMPGGQGRSDVVLQSHGRLISLAHWPRLLWNLSTGQPQQAAPLALTNSTGQPVIIQLMPGQGGSALSCLDAHNGRTLWTDSQFHVAANRPPALADLDGDGVLNVVAMGYENASGRNCLIVRRAADGKLVRAPVLDLPRTWISCTPAIADFRGIGKCDVAAATWETHEIALFDGRSGEKLWKYKTDGPNMGGLTAASLEQGRLPDVIAASLDGHIYAFRGDNGRLLWKSSGTNCTSFSRPVVARLNAEGAPQVLATTFDGKLVVLDGQTGALMWSPAMSGEMSISGQPAVVSENGRGIIIAPLGVLGVVAFDWQRRQELWRSPAGCPVIGSPVVADLAHDGNKEVIIGAARGEVMALRLADGKTLWRQKIARGPIEADPVVDDLQHHGVDDVLIVSHDFGIYAIDGRAIVSSWRQSGIR